MFTSKKPTNKQTVNLPIVKWCDYPFEVYSFKDIAMLSSIECVFILAGKNIENGNWVPFYVDLSPINLNNTNSFNKILNEAKANGSTHIHIAKLKDLISKNLLHDNLIEKHMPLLNRDFYLSTHETEKMTTENEYSEELSGTRSKLELLYKYEAHYLELIKNYKEEIKFANTLQEDLRRERSQFFTQTLKEVIQTMKIAEVDKEVSSKWVEELVDSYTKSIDLSGDLAKTHVIEVLSILKNEAKQEASQASIDNIANKMKP